MSEEIEYSTHVKAMPDEIKEMWDSLTDKQRKFIVYFVHEGNGTRSAIKAGYSKVSARQTANVNMSKHDIRPVVDWMQAYIMDNALDNTISTAAERMQLLTEIQRSSMSDFTLTGDVIDLTAEGANPQCVKELTTTTDEQGSLITKIKLYSSIDAIKELNKMQGSYAADKIRHVDKNDNDVEPPKPLIIATKDMTDKDLEDIGYVES